MLLLNKTWTQGCKDIMTVTAFTQEMETVNQVKDTRVTQEDTQQLFAGMMINNNLVNFQIDYGATCNVTPVDILDYYPGHTD